MTGLTAAVVVAFVFLFAAKALILAFSIFGPDPYEADDDNPSSDPEQKD